MVKMAPSFTGVQSFVYMAYTKIGKVSILAYEDIDFRLMTGMLHQNGMVNH